MQMHPFFYGFEFQIQLIIFYILFHSAPFWRFLRQAQNDKMELLYANKTSL